MARMHFIHTKKDAHFAGIIEWALSQAGIEADRSELKSLRPPYWQSVLEEIKNSTAVALPVGEELSRTIEQKEAGWKSIYSWISFEIGLACQLGRDVWVICDDREVNFPVPYLNHYIPENPDNPDIIELFHDILFFYGPRHRDVPVPYVSRGVNHGLECPYDDCRIEFNLFLQKSRRESILCPHCLRPIEFLVQVT